MDADTLDYLENRLVIQHAHFQDVQNQVLRAVQYGRSDQALCVFGPTGVGKTTMQSYLNDVLIRKQENGWRKDCSPPVLVEAPAQINGKFSWRALTVNILEALGETDIASKVDLDAMEEGIKKGLECRIRSRLDMSQLEKLVRDRIKALRPICIFVDEGQHIVERLSISAQIGNANILKHWANTMDTKFIVFGTHEAQGLLNQNEQLSRRVAPIYFPRYRISEPDEYEQFFYFYGNLVKELDLQLEPAIHQDFRFIYNYSLGCPGILVTWLHECIAYCIDKNIKKLTKAILQKHRISTDRLKTMEQAIKNFEAYYESTRTEFDPSTVYADDFGQQDLGLAPVRPSKTLTPKNKKRIQQKPRSYPVHATKPQQDSNSSDA